MGGRDAEALSPDQATTLLEDLKSEQVGLLHDGQPPVSMWVLISVGVAAVLMTRAIPVVWLGLVLSCLITVGVFVGSLLIVKRTDSGVLKPREPLPIAPTVGLGLWLLALIGVLIAAFWVSFPWWFWLIAGPVFGLTEYMLTRWLLSVRPRGIVA